MTLKLMDLTRAWLWVEMNPNFVLPAMIEVKDGEWNFIVIGIDLGNEKGKNL